MWTRSQGDCTVSDIDRMSGLPPDTFWAKWCGGAIFPLLILWPALRAAIIARTAVFRGRGYARLNLDGTDAVLFGVVLGCVALFLQRTLFEPD